MGEYEPNDSRNITQGNATAPGEPPRTGPREGETRKQGEQGVRAAPHAAAEGGQTQSQGQSQSMGGMSQSQGGYGQASSPPRTTDSQADENSQASADVARSPSGSVNAATTFSANHAFDRGEAQPSGADTPQAMQQTDPQAEERRRQQAAGQDRQDAPRPADEDKAEHDLEDRGYGGAGEERVDRLEKDG